MNHTNKIPSTRTTLLVLVGGGVTVSALLFAGGDSGLARAAVTLDIYESETEGRFPIQQSNYQSVTGTTFLGAPIPVQIQSMKLTGPPTSAGTVPLPPPGSNAQFDSFFDIFTELSIGPGGSPQPVDSFFDITYRVGGGGGGSGGSGGPDGVWPTEIVALQSQGQITGPNGPIPVAIRESPTLQSLGSHSITTKADGTFVIDSFFDIFTELSLNGGPFVPADSSFRLDLTSVAPEPGSIVLAILGATGCGLVARRFRHRESLAG